MSTNDQSSKPIRVRMAPSPTGSLHIGGVRTALYNMLFARKLGGTFILRIEDTDAERSTKAFEQEILDSFAWSGIVFDEGVMPDGSEKGAYGPYRQTECLDSYEKHLARILEEDKAYYCFCSKEELEAQAADGPAEGVAPKYSGKCRSISLADARARIAGGEAPVIRLKVPAEKVVFTDLIRGEVVFDNALIGDIVIAKGLRQPLYNFAVVIDDATMQISHVIRGEEHLANTPKQIAIARALGLSSPQFAHLPIILSATGKGKMSKRDGGTTVREYKEAGYLPEALINFLVLLGWHPSGDEEVMTLEQMVAQFSLDRVQKSGAKFDKEKLNWFNNHYLRLLSDEKLAQLSGAPVKFVPLFKERANTLIELGVMAKELITVPEYPATLLVWRKSDAAGAKVCLSAARAVVAGLGDMSDSKAIEGAFAGLLAEKGKGDVLWPLRVALSGKEASPGPFDLLAALGQAESLARIDAGLAKL